MALQLWQPRIKIGPGTKFLGLVEAIEEDIVAGLLQPGAPMPAQRSVATALGIDLTTVTRAYNEARLRGLIEARPGRGGTRVSGAAEAAAQRALAHPVDLSLNIPPQPARADLAARLARATGDVLKGGAELLQYGVAVGSDGDRLAGAAWLRPALGPVDAGRIVVASGAQSALFAIMASLLAPGDRIGMGAVTYPGARLAARRLGAEPVPLAMDGEGVTPDALTAAGPLSALYLVPTIDNPTTATLSETRRRALVEIARRAGTTIIEDDPYRCLAATPPRALAALAPERSFHVATLAKCATPGLRIAYVAAPTPAAAEAVGAVLRDTSLMAPPLMAAAASRWIADGTLARIAEAVREESAARQAIAARLLAGLDIARDPHGHHLWLALPQAWPSAVFAARAEQSGVAVVPAADFATGAAMPNAVRVSLGAARDRASLGSGLRRLAELLTTAPRRALV